MQNGGSRSTASMAIPWAHSYKRYADEVEQSAAKRTCFEHSSAGESTGESTGSMAVPDFNLAQPPLRRIWHRRTTAVTNTGMSTLSRNSSDIKVETCTGYELATMTDFRTDMSVKEKLSLGYSQSFHKSLEFDARIQETSGGLLSARRNEIMGRGGLGLVDRFLGFSYALRQETVAHDAEIQNRMYGLPDTETTLEETKDGYDCSNERRRLNEHFLARSRFVKRAHQRLAIAIRPCNRKTHTIPGLVARRRSDQIMNVEWQQDYHGMAMNMSFSAFQSRSMEENGYRKREIRRLHFRKVDDAHQTFPGPPLDTATAEDYGANSSTEMYFQDGVDGSLSMVELDM
ncbi:uncharacterized protein ColSpa_10063 [Colletotrichum spaethianum]|uniref:Uncharacterized protein n=1 Tax=Colletotrichum spaethianum TaxID=700344 RepID=A0AA37PCV9_9PEZI|nr:uncharacterized protein ColSpa_10063 [Colletotrichum spaethianum]GKT49882.1 hypothetical protein ColSpa_10063 [Colletotrichum spaethianum]